MALILRGVASLGVTSSELAARRARRLPEWIWATHSLVRATRRGLNFELDLRDNVERSFFFTGYYERRYLELLEEQLQAGDVFLDVGAHIGIHTITIARALERQSGSVVAFEPIPSTFERLKRNIQANRIENVTLVNLALSDSRRGMSLFSDPVGFHAADTAVASFVGPGTEIAEVQAVTFDSWARQERVDRIDLIKLDVEGGELDCLIGMRESIERFEPRLIGVEIRPYLLERAGVSPEAPSQLLGEMRYQRVATDDLEGNTVFELSM